MGRNVLLLIAFAGLLLAGVTVLNGADAASGIKQRLSKEESLSISVHAAPIDLHQPQHLKTATFALG